MHFLPFSSPCPIRPKRPITILQGQALTLSTPWMKSHNLAMPIFRAEAFFLRFLETQKQHLVVLVDQVQQSTNEARTQNRAFPYRFGISMLMVQVSRSSPVESVATASSQRWSSDKQYDTNKESACSGFSPSLSDNETRSFCAAKMYGGVNSFVTRVLPG